jgi:hypothetical protein
MPYKVHLYSAKNLPKTPCKNLLKIQQKLPKNPQKSFMEPIKIFDRKLFFDFMHQALTQNKDIKYAMINIVTFSVMFPEMKKLITSAEDEILINGIKIQLSKLCPQENVYFAEQKFTTI